jgi:hypothetical protein
MLDGEAEFAEREVPIKQAVRTFAVSAYAGEMLSAEWS